MSDIPETFERDVMLGLSRSGKAVAQPLQSLSLFAARRKFAPHKRPDAQFSAGFVRSETTPLMPDGARKHLIRLVAGRDGKANDAMAAAALQALADRRLSLHPFDYAALEDFVLHHADDVGPDARQWLSLTHPGKEIAAAAYFDDAITEENLGQAPRAQQLRYLRDMRRTDPPRAKTLIEAMIAGEAAAMRLKLLSILSTNLGELDRELIERHMADRAPAVKELATRLLSSLPGTEGHQRRMALLKDYFEIKPEGILRRKKVLRYKGPDGKKADESERHILSCLQDVSLTDVAAALDLSEGDLVDMALAAEIRALTAGILRLAVLSARSELLAPHRDAFKGQALDILAAVYTPNFSELPSDHQDRISGIVLQPSTWTEFPNYHSMQSIAAHITRALPENVAMQLMETKAWTSLAEGLHAQYADLIAPLMPHTLSIQFIAFAETRSPRAATYHKFLHALTSR